MNAVSNFAFKLIIGFYHPEIAVYGVPESCTTVTKAIFHIVSSWMRYNQLKLTSSC